MKYTRETVAGVEYIYSADWIKNLETKEHWEYYWHQQKLMDGLLEPGRDKVLEIGVGTGFATNYMRSRGHDVTTLDIDPGKSPDILANVVTYEFKQHFDAVMAFEILEHIPYSEFVKIIQKFAAMEVSLIFLSLPQNTGSLLRVSMKLPKVRAFELDVRAKRRKITTPAHHWEMDHGGHSVADVEQLFLANGFHIRQRVKVRSIHFYALSRASG